MHMRTVAELLKQACAFSTSIILKKLSVVYGPSAVCW